MGGGMGVREGRNGEAFRNSGRKGGIRGRNWSSTEEAGDISGGKGK